MRSVAFFLGAGASKAFGFPLTGDLFPRIRHSLCSGGLFGKSRSAREQEKLLAEYLEALLPGYCIPEIQLPLITDILSLVDYSIVSRTTPLIRRDASEVVRLRSLLERAIYEVVRRRMPDDGSESGRRRFCRWLASNRGTTQPFGVITTNYDLAIEERLFERLNYNEIYSIDFGFAWRDPNTERGEVHPRPQQPSMSLFKLHGSLNWLDCAACEQTYLNVEGDIASLSLDEKRTDWNSCHCGHGILRMKLVAPSLIRDVRDPVLLEIWRSAVELLRTSTKWVIAGYSLPPEDIAIRSIMMRAYQGREKPPVIDVVQYGEDNARDDRFRLLFPNARIYTDGMQAYLDRLCP